MRSRSNERHHKSPRTRTRQQAGRMRHGIGRRGAAVVELSLLTPLLAVLLLGICELGQGLWVNACLSEAARIGSETGARPGCCNADVIADVNGVLKNNAIPTGSTTITILVNNQTGNVAAARKNDKITVTVAVPTAKVAWTKSFSFLGSNSTLSQSGSMLKQG
ncbi:MAG: pilus assembly protein [Planctomycetia bacterium]|nr:pilus assembly protein [Planctomycetia bacterium]